MGRQRQLIWVRPLNGSRDWTCVQRATEAVLRQLQKRAPEVANVSADGSIASETVDLLAHPS